MLYKSTTATAFQKSDLQRRTCYHFRRSSLIIYTMTVWSDVKNNQYKSSIFKWPIINVDLWGKI